MTAKHFTEEELNNLDKQAIIALALSMQDQVQQLTGSINRLTEQVAALNQYRFGRRTEKSYIIPDGQMNLFDFFNEAEAYQRAPEHHSMALPDLAKCIRPALWAKMPVGIFTAPAICGCLRCWRC